MSPHEKARWNFLGDLVFEDIMRLGEAVQAATESWPGVAHAEHVALAEEIIGGLLADGLVEVFLAEGGDPDASAASGPRIDRGAVLDMIRAGCRDPRALHWWVAATASGWSAVVDPPPEVRFLWRWPADFVPPEAADL